MAPSDFMLVVFAFAAAVVLFAVIVLALGRGDGLDGDDAGVPAPALPEHQVSSTDVDGVRFIVAARGYRMDQVDGVLARLADELDQRDRRIAELEAETISGPRNPPGDR